MRRVVAVPAAQNQVNTRRGGWGRGVYRSAVVVLATALILAGLSTPQWVSQVTGAVAAAEGTGTGGSFVPVQQHLFDSRTGLGNGGTVAPLPADTPKTIQVTGAAGIPASGVSSVVVTVSQFDTATSGQLVLGADINATFIALIFDANSNDSNTAVVDLSSTGSMVVRTQYSGHVAIEVQGYFATGNGTPAPGGYVSVSAQGLTSQANGACQMVCVSDGPAGKDYSFDHD